MTTTYEFLGHWVPLDPAYERGFWRWMRYYALTEQFDLLVCRRRDPRGVAVPFYLEELEACGNNARRWCRLLGLTPTTQGQEEAVRYSHQAVIEQLADKFPDENWTTFDNTLLVTGRGAPW